MTHSNQVEEELILSRPTEIWRIHMRRDPHISHESWLDVWPRVACLDMTHLEWAMTHTSYESWLTPIELRKNSFCHVPFKRHSVGARLDMPHLQWAMTHTYHICHDLFTWHVTHSWQMSSRKKKHASRVFFAWPIFAHLDIIEWVMSNVCMCHVYLHESRPACDWVTCVSHMWICQVTHTNESCHTCDACEMSHVTHKNESCRTCEYVMLRMWHESCHTYEWVMSHTWMSRVTHMNEVASHIWISHATYMDESYRTHE